MMYLPTSYLKKLLDGFYATKVVITPQEANEIEQETRDQHAIVTRGSGNDELELQRLKLANW